MSGPAGTDLVGARLEERLRAGERFFTAESERIARLCHRMAERFARGGRLIALGGDGVGAWRDWLVERVSERAAAPA